MRQGVHDVVDADANAEREILLSSFLADKGRAVYETLTLFRLRTRTLVVDERKQVVALSAGSLVEVVDEQTPGNAMVHIWADGRSVHMFADDLNERGERLIDES